MTFTGFAQTAVFCIPQIIHMKTLVHTIILFAFTGLFSCAGNEKEDYVDKDLQKEADQIKSTQKKDSATSAIATAVQQAPAPVVTGSSPLTSQPVTIGGAVQPAPSATVQQPVAVTPQPAAQTATAAGMNPPHGQPGHRCDIPVGSPLNSKPQTTSPPAATVTTAAPTAQATAPGMNPPHGQPGHRCDIPVGSPLNSKPAPAPAASISTTPAAAPANTSARPDSSKND